MKRLSHQTYDGERLTVYSGPGLSHISVVPAGELREASTSDYRRKILLIGRDARGAAGVQVFTYSSGALPLMS